MSSSKLSLNHVPAIVPSCWGYSNRLSRETFFSHRPLFTYPSKSRRIMSYNSYTFTNYHFKMASVRNEERPNLGGPWCLTKPREQTTGYQAELQDSSSKMSGTRRRRPDGNDQNPRAAPMLRLLSSATGRNHLLPHFQTPR